MKYPVNTSAIIDVTKPPYCADNTGKTDCTDILVRILDDILIRQVDALKNTYDHLIEISNNKQENAYIGIESGRVENGVMNITFPEYEPSNKIIYFPKGTYLVSNTITYSLDNLKQIWYWVPGFENNRNIHFLGENKDDTIIKLKDNAQGFGKGEKRPLISFANNELDVTRDKEFTNVAFMNYMKDITIDCGNGNPGAIGIKYASSNCGRLENINIKTESGLCGIYVANSTSQAVFSDIEISGFDYGIDSQKTVFVALKNIDVSRCRISGLYTDKSNLICTGFNSGNIPHIMFNKEFESTVKGRYFFDSENIKIANESKDNQIYCKTKIEIPQIKYSEDSDDWAFVDDFGAKGDGKSDSSRAIQKAMDSGKSHIAFGEGEYLINAKIKIPESVKVIDFLFCSLATGDRLIGGEYDSAFEISENSTEPLFVTNLSAWERFKGHIRFVKHDAKRDAIFSNIHLMCCSMYFNTVSGNTVYFDNCFLTTGTYTRTAWIPGEGFVPVYSHIIPYEFHGQKVYAANVNPERADIALLNDNSDVYIEGFRTEGPGTAIKCINGGTTKINMFNSAIGCKTAENPVCILENSYCELNGAAFIGFDVNSEYNIIIENKNDNTTETILWDDVDTNIFEHGKLLPHYKNH